MESVIKMRNLGMGVGSQKKFGCIKSGIRTGKTSMYMIIIIITMIIQGIPLNIFILTLVFLVDPF